MADLHLTQTVIDAFNALADQAQELADRNTVLEHKLRFAHEQFQYLADRYAPAAPEIAKTVAKLQPPPHPPLDDASLVPLPRRGPRHSRHQVALIIRDGRRAASKLASLGEASKTTVSTKDALSHASLVEQSSMSTALEQDFTVEGRKGNLQCPFSSSGDAADADAAQAGPRAQDPPLRASTCQDSSPSVVNGAQASKCPIRFMDERSPEEIAHYVEAHKHELPRSHELCLRRYQRNDEQVKKLDSKYGNIVSMIEDLSQLHKPMLPEEDGANGSRASNERVVDWAQQVGAQGNPEAADDAGRRSPFDRPLREVRVGESPSRPWGISVPIYDFPASPPPAPVRLPTPSPNAQPPATPEVNKCPFDHAKFPSPSAGPHAPPDSSQGHISPQHHTQPVFVKPESLTTGVPHMVFTGPVFIGYPMDQALQFMNQYRPS